MTKLVWLLVFVILLIPAWLMLTGSPVAGGAHIHALWR